jgi:hypothetical protein
MPVRSQEPLKEMHFFWKGEKLLFRTEYLFSKVKQLCVGVSQLFLAVTKYLKETIWKEIRFILDHSFRGFSHGHLALFLGYSKRHSGANCLPHGTQKAERKGPGTRYTFQSHFPSDLLSPTNTHLLKTHSPMNYLMRWSSNEVDVITIHSALLSATRGPSMVQTRLAAKD